MPKPLTLSEKLDRFPPLVIRLLARCQKSDGGVRALTDAEIAKASSLPETTVAHLSKQTSWDAIDIATMQAFCRGCGAELDSRDWLRKNAAYMASIRGAPRYLRKSSEWDTKFEPLIRILVRHEQAKAA